MLKALLRLEMELVQLIQGHMPKLRKPQGMKPVPVPVPVPALALALALALTALKMLQAWGLQL
jgi:hypothetical protein